MTAGSNVQARQFKALADDTRLAIEDMLCGGELCACNILKNFQITQPTLSYHMKILTECNLVKAHREGAWMRYSLNQKDLKALCSRLSGICSCCGQDQSQASDSSPNRRFKEDPS